MVRVKVFVTEGGTDRQTDRNTDKQIDRWTDGRTTGFHVPCCRSSAGIK